MLFFLLINVNIYEQEKFHAQLSSIKKFYNLGVRSMKANKRKSFGFSS